MLDRIFAHLTDYPEGFTVHPKLVRQFEARAKLYHENGMVDWATAEALAIGSLVLEGTPVRLAGEDTRRGTFSQRHAALIDYENETSWIPLAELPERAGQVLGLRLAAQRVRRLGYEYGYAHANHDALVMWEAQFGDFVNGAQIIIDQYLVAAEDKWGQDNGLVLLLPHGYEGQGPEHSSARIERFLTPAPRTTSRSSTPPRRRSTSTSCAARCAASVRKPLVRVHAEVSAAHEADPVADRRARRTGSFEEVLDDPFVGRPGSRAAGSCSARQGGVGRDRRARQARRAASRSSASSSSTRSRPSSCWRSLERYPNARELVWLQEEPENMGPWHFVEHRTWRIKERGYDLRHVARVESGSPATGSQGDPRPGARRPDGRDVRAGL